MAAKILDIPTIQPFDCKGDSNKLLPLWVKWKKCFEYYVTAVGVTDDSQKQALLLLHLIGSDGQEIFDTLGNTGNTFVEALEKLDKYFMPKCNIIYERCVFLSSLQRENETIDMFVTSSSSSSSSSSSYSV